MNLIPIPRAELSDADVADGLSRAVGLIDVILDLLAEADPFGLRRRTHDLGSGRGITDHALDLVAGLLDCADLPGTRSWDHKDEAARIRWWVRRVGAIDTVAVAFPGVFGVLAKRLPVQDIFGFANQALVLCAVARESGVTDHDTQVRLLAAVLCGRELADPVPEPDPAQDSGQPLVKKLWKLAGVMNAIGDELEKRPHPQRVFDYLGMLPWVGAVAGYFGEFGALQRAAAAGQEWLSTSEA